MHRTSLSGAFLLLICVSAYPALTASAKDPTGIVAAVQSGSSAAAVSNLANAGQANSDAVVAALVQIFSDGSSRDLSLLAQAASTAILQKPAIYPAVLAAFSEAVLGQLTINTTASIQTAGNVLAALRAAQQPAIVQSILAAAFNAGLAVPAAKATAAVGGATCSNGTFLAASYSLALTNTIAINATAAGQAFAAANNVKYGGCQLAAAAGASVAMATAGCANDTLDMLHAAQMVTIATTGDNTAMATAIASYAPNDDTFYCLVKSIITGSGEDAVAQAAAWESYNTVTNQTLLGAGMTNSSKVAGAGESLFEATEKGPNTASGMSSLAGLAALAQTTGCSLIYPVLIQSQNYMTPAIFQASVSQSAALSACYALGQGAAAS